jgi:hypothetical protein
MYRYSRYKNITLKVINIIERINYTHYSKDDSTAKSTASTRLADG